MGTYSIKDLEKLSGIRAHTLRIWEKRHGVMAPERTATNIRFYDDEDLKKILCVALLNSHGIKISRIVALSGEEIIAKVMELTKHAGGSEGQINRMIIAMVDLDEQKFTKLLNDLILKTGFEDTILQVIYPFLEKIGVLWQTNNIQPAHEHFISCLIRQKLISAIDAIDPIATKETDFVLYLPEHELHELGLLFYDYLIRIAGYSSIYMGQSLPYQDLKRVVATRGCKHIVTSFITPFARKDLEAYLARLVTDFPKMRILVSGHQVHHHGITSKGNLHVFGSVTEFKDLL